MGLLSLSAFAATPPKTACVLDESSVAMKWTAFKTSSKTPVSGTFTKLIVSQTPKVIELAIDSTSVSSGNPARDLTLNSAFFKLFNPMGKFSVSVPNQVVGTQKQGKLTVHGIGAKTFTIPVTVVKTGNTLKLNGTLDLLKIGQKAAFDSLHKSCEVLHRGTDGVSKTWSEVEIEATATIKEGC